MTKIKTTWKSDCSGDNTERHYMGARSKAGVSSWLKKQASREDRQNAKAIIREQLNEAN